jgi:hypothetical protein
MLRDVLMARERKGSFQMLESGFVLGVEKQCATTPEVDIRFPVGVLLVSGGISLKDP